MDAVYYFAIEAIAMPFMQMNSILFCLLFWYLYAAELFWMSLEAFYLAFI